jgi:uncharacterized protein
MGSEQKVLMVVFDTSTVVSALLFRQGRLTWVRGLWIAGRITPLCSQATLAELTRVLAYPKFDLGEAEIRDLLDDYLVFVEAVDVASGSGHERLAQCRDPDDQIFLELALVGHADVVVTGDSDLLSLARQVPFAVETPAKFKKRFEARAD